VQRWKGGTLWVYKFHGSEEKLEEAEGWIQCLFSVLRLFYVYNTAMRAIDIAHRLWAVLGTSISKVNYVTKVVWVSANVSDCQLCQRTPLLEFWRQILPTGLLLSQTGLPIAHKSLHEDLRRGKQGSKKSELK